MGRRHAYNPERRDAPPTSPRAEETGDPQNPQNSQTTKRRRIGGVAGSGDALAFNEMGNVISRRRYRARLRPQLRPGGRDGRVRLRLRGMALNLEESSVGVVIFGDDREILEGDAQGTGAIVDVRSAKVCWAASSMAWESLLMVPDRSRTSSRGRAEVKAPGIIPRQSVSEPRADGVKAVDALIPIGRGQRELIIGDRQTGKTAIAIDTIINQKTKGDDA